MAKEPWGREHWERISQGLQFDGMESWLPWLVGDATHRGPARPTARTSSTSSPTSCPTTAWCCWSSPVGCGTGRPTSRPRRTTSPGRSPAPGARCLPSRPPAPSRAQPATRSPSCTCPSTGCSPTPTRRCGRMTTVPEGPEITTVQAMGWDPVVGDGSTLTDQLERLLADGYRVVVGADGPGLGATACTGCWASGGSTCVLDEEEPSRGPRGRAVSCGSPRSSGAASSRRSSWRSWPRPTSPAGAGPTGGPGPAATSRPSASSRTSAPATTSCTTPTASAATRAWSPGRSAASSATTCSLAYKGGDKLYVPSDQIDIVRHYTGGDAPTLHRLGGSDFARTKAKVRSAVQEVAQELVVLYQKRVTSEGHAFPPDTPWQERDGGVVPLRRDARPAHRHRRREGRHGAGRTRWTAWCAATSASARPRWPSAPRSRRCRTASRWRCWCRRPSWPSSTSRPSPSGWPPTRCGSRCCRGSSPPARPARWPRGCPTARSTSSSAPTACCRRTSPSNASACSSSTRSSASACSTRSASRR